MLRQIFKIRSGHTPRHLLLNTVRSLLENSAATTASSIAFFALFSLFPLLLILTVISNYFFSAHDVGTVALQKVLRLFPGSRPFIRTSLAEMPVPSGTTVVTISLAFLWACSWMISLLEGALNRAWHVTKYRSFWRARLLALVMIASGGALLVLSVVITVFISALQRMTENLGLDVVFGESGAVWRFGIAAAGVIMTFLGFLITYKLLPNTEVAFFEVVPGALTSTLLWQAANYLFAYVVPKFNYQHIHGSLAAVIVMLTWVYVSCLILLLGAHMSALMHRIAPEQLRDD